MPAGWAAGRTGGVRGGGCKSVVMFRTPPASTRRRHSLSKGCPPAAPPPAVTLTDLYFKFSKCHTRRRVDLGGRRAAATRRCHATFMHECQDRGPMSHFSDRGERAGEEVACTQTVVRRAQNRNKRLTLMTDARFSSLGVPRLIVFRSRCRPRTARPPADTPGETAGSRPRSRCLSCTAPVTLSRGT